MNMRTSHHAMRQYQQTNTNAQAAYADPHQLIAMLFNGALEKIAIAKGAMQRGELAQKGEAIGRVIAIVDGLRASLDADKGGDIARNLDALYEYMQRRLFEANNLNDSDLLDEVSALIKEVKSAWDLIPEEVRAQAKQVA